MKSRCPVCKKVIDTAAHEQSRQEGFYPFCCNRCKLIDLGRWIDGKYRIASKLRAEEEDSENAGHAEEDEG